VRELLRVSKALSDETRVRMLKLLMEKDICICEMKRIFPKSESQISRHLKILMDAGFLRRWNEGRCVVYVADKDNSNKYCRALLEVLANSFEDDKQLSKDRERLRKVIKDQVREKSK
jgi:ArsR family transcriptional regulator